nr:hypothetical protein [Tanacetum cinerariifolium]
PSRKRRRSPMTSVPALPLVSGALSPVRADLIPPPKRLNDIGYLADVEIDPREIRYERVTHPAMPKDIPEPRLRGTASVESQRVDRLQRGMSRENGGNENGGNGWNGNGDNGGNGNEGNGNHGMNYGGFMPMARECTFQDFLKCKPHTFSGTEGVVRLTRCALTWWNSHKSTIGVDAAYAMKWARLMKLMTEVYCPRNEQPPFKRQNATGQNVARAYTAGNNERKGYVGSLPYCSKCKLHHKGLCTIRCGNCKKVGHQTKDCRVTVNPNTQGAAIRNQQGVVCYECGRQGHFRKDCPKLRNQNRGNQTRNKTGNKTGGNEVTARAYAIGHGYVSSQ